MSGDLDVIAFSTFKSNYQLVVATNVMTICVGWLYHRCVSLGEPAARARAAIWCLQRAVAAEPESGAGLYLLGRCFAAQGKVHDAFIAYRNSVEKSEGNADTWCSIG